jgi:hypothetical protein
MEPIERVMIAALAAVTLIAAATEMLRFRSAPLSAGLAAMRPIEDFEDLSRAYPTATMPGCP